MEMDASFEVMEGFLLLGYKGIYKVEKFLGEGTFGKVAKCTTLGSEESVAVKIIKKEYEDAGREEQEALKEVSRIDADQNNLVKCLDCFPYKSHTCIVFEMLDISLEDLMHQRDYKPLSICEVKTIASQLLVALDSLKCIDVVHGDIKLDNVMLVDQKSQPFKVKVIDFGLATKSSDLPTGTLMQNSCYRAPEVILGLPLDERLDMWTLGYVLAVLYTGVYIHGWGGEYNVVKAMVGLQGIPGSALLDRGVYSRKFFTPVQHESGVVWELVTADQFTQNTGEKVNKDHCRDFDTYKDMVDFYHDKSKIHEAQQFVDLLERMLLIDPAKRITPRDALRHPFITGVLPPTEVRIPGVTLENCAPSWEEPDSVPALVSAGAEEPKKAASLNNTDKAVSNHQSPIVALSRDSWVSIDPDAFPPNQSFTGNPSPDTLPTLVKGFDASSGMPLETTATAAEGANSDENQVTREEYKGQNQEPILVKVPSTKKSFRLLRELVSKVCKLLKLSRV